MDIITLVKTATYVDTLQNYYLLAISNSIANIFLVFIDVIISLFNILIF